MFVIICIYMPKEQPRPPIKPPVNPPKPHTPRPEPSQNPNPKREKDHGGLGGGRPPFTK